MSYLAFHNAQFPSAGATTEGLQFGHRAEQFTGSFETSKEPDDLILATGYAGYHFGYYPATTDVSEESYGFQGTQFEGTLVSDPVVPADMPTLDPLDCGQLQLIRGDDYTGVRAICFAFVSSVAPLPSDFATWTWTDPYCDEAIGELTTSTFEQVGKYEYVAKFDAIAFASDNRPGQWPFDVQLSIDNTDTRTIATGILDLIVDQTR